MDGADARSAQWIQSLDRDKGQTTGTPHRDKHERKEGTQNAVVTQYASADCTVQSCFHNLV